jgi:hypothetical protein
VVRMVVTKADEIAVQALYRMRSARQRLTVQLPAGAQFDAQPLKINGRPSALETGQKDEYYVPLPAGSEDKPLLVELRYRLPGDGRRLDLPVFPQEPAVVKAYLCVYLPENRTLLGVRGPWSEEFGWRPDGWRWRSVPMAGTPPLPGWVQEGLPGVQGTAEDFPTDGRLFVFSTLRPAKPPEGSLLTTTIHARWLDALVFGITLLLGLVLLPARLPVRALAVGAAVTGLVLAGVFLPTFSAQILGGVLAAAVFIVAVLWVAAYVAGRGRRPPAMAAAAGGIEHGVDLSQYRPEPPVVEPPVPPAATAPPVEPSKPEGTEGGQSHA